MIQLDLIWTQLQQYGGLHRQQWLVIYSSVGHFYSTQDIYNKGIVGANSVIGFGVML